MTAANPTLAEAIARLQKYDAICPETHKTFTVGRDDVRTLIAALLPEPCGGDWREKAARIIDPWSFERAECDPETEEARSEALTKADAIAALGQPTPGVGDSLQARVQPWMMACFGPEISADRLERGDRLLEEVLELLQSGDYPRERVAALTDYTFNREKGEPHQEVGGVQITLAAYCLAHDLDMHQAGEDELARIWTKVAKIRAKQAAKPTGSALPIATPPKAEGPDGWSSDMEAAPRDGTEIEAWCVHSNAKFSAEPIKEGWACKVRARWIDHNGGGWTWDGLAGAFTHWRTPPSPATTDGLAINTKDKS